MCRPKMLFVNLNAKNQSVGLVTGKIVKGAWLTSNWVRRILAARHQRRPSEQPVPVLEAPQRRVSHGRCLKVVPFAILTVVTPSNLIGRSGPRRRDCALVTPDPTESNGALDAKARKSSPLPPAARNRAARPLHDRVHGGQDRFTKPRRRSSAETASAVRRMR